MVYSSPGQPMYYAELFCPQGGIKHINISSHICKFNYVSMPKPAFKCCNKTSVKKNCEKQTKNQSYCSKVVEKV